MEETSGSSGLGFSIRSNSAKKTVLGQLCPCLRVLRIACSV